MKEKLSIIIPAYNAEAFIERCLNSILNQDYHNDIEIIVVNDGCTDSTGSILNKYQKQNPSVFRIITKENGGVSSARNAGLDAATGDWIWFCDADDYICKNGLSYVLDNFVDSEIDICTFGGISLDSRTLNSFVEPDAVSGNIIYEGSTISNYKESYPVFVYSQIYRKSAIKGIRFRSTPIGEDAFFNLEVYMRDLRLRRTNTHVYRYTVSDGQATRKRDRYTMRKAIAGYEVLFDTIKKFQKEKSDEELSNELERKIALTSIAYMSRVLCAELSKGEFVELICRLKQKGIFPFLELNRKIKVVNSIGRFPVLYPSLCFLYQKLFIPYIMPKLSRN